MVWLVVRKFPAPTTTQHAPGNTGAPYLGRGSTRPWRDTCRRRPTCVVVVGGVLPVPRYLFPSTCFQVGGRTQKVSIAQPRVCECVCVYLFVCVCTGWAFWEGHHPPRFLTRRALLASANAARIRPHRYRAPTCTTHAWQACCLSQRRRRRSKQPPDPPLRHRTRTHPSSIP